MKNALIIGLLLCVIGVVGLAYGGITYTSHRDVVNLGPIHATINEEKTIPIAPIVGAVALVAGLALLYSNRTNARLQ